jgi:hypothetical protein
MKLKPLGPWWILHLGIFNDPMTDISQRSTNLHACAKIKYYYSPLAVRFRLAFVSWPKIQHMGSE